MKVLFIGLGSIGQRHLQNFIEMAPFGSEILTYRSSDSKNIIINGKVKCFKNIGEYYKLKEFHNLQHALNQYPDIAFICNPSSLHIKIAIKIAKKNMHFFVEKPLSTNIQGIVSLRNLVNKNHLITMIGYQTRFHPAVIEAKKIISEKKYGDIISAEFKWCTYLPNHHPYEDYHEGYAAKKNLGGGVIFSLIHELDIIQWIFGMPSEVYALKGANSKLGIDVEDNVTALFKFKSFYKEKKIFPVSLNLSFSQGLEERYFNILMQDGVLKCDLISNTLILSEHDNKKLSKNEYTNLQRNDLFKLEMKNFLNSILKKKETDIPISEGEKSLRLALAVHKSVEINGPVDI